MPKRVLFYQAYLLRLWRSDGAPGWRASLEDPHSGVRRGFATLEHLIAFLHDQAGQQTPDLPADAEPTKKATDQQDP